MIARLTLIYDVDAITLLLCDLPDFEIRGDWDGPANSCCVQTTVAPVDRCNTGV